MAKLLNAVILIVFIEIGLMLFSGGDATAADKLVAWFINPSDVLALINVFTASFAMLGIGLLTVTGVISIGATVFNYKNDIVVFAPMIATIIFFAGAFIDLWRFMASQTILCGIIESSETMCGTSMFLASILCVPLAIYYIITVLDWWRGRD